MTVWRLTPEMAVKMVVMMAIWRLTSVMAVKMTVRRLEKRFNIGICRVRVIFAAHTLKG